MRTPDVLDFALEITRRQDHAGFRLAFGLLSWNFDFSIYDSRHWDHANKDWYRYEQDY